MLQQKQYGLSMVRLIAMTSIILCHVAQYDGRIVCYYLNIGVWLFLFISGYLYGSKEIGDPISFYKKRLLRILVPYYMMLTIIVLVNLLHGERMTMKEVLSSFLCLQWYGTTIPNCGHLWYISCILFCYLITPILRWFACRNRDLPLFRKWIMLAFSILMLQIVYSLGGMKQATTSIVPYILGYFIASNSEKLKKYTGGGYSVAGCIAGFGMYCAMYILEVSGRFDVPNLLLDYYKSIAAAAVVLFLLPLRFENVLVQRILDFNDRYSYGFYLTHHIFILGSLSVMALTPYWQVNVAIAFFAAMVTGFGLIWFSDAVILMLKKYDSNNLKKRKRMVLE